jgi:serine/threonine protein kinase
VKGLREVHANKLLHLDLKPANIYLRTDGTPMLLDFGAARQTINTDMPTLTPMYTPGFAPPELYAKTGMGPWTDIYSIGASMFACMVGSPPQPADQRKPKTRWPGTLKNWKASIRRSWCSWCAGVCRSIRWTARKACSPCRRCWRRSRRQPHRRTAAQSMLDKLRGLVGRGGGAAAAARAKAGPDTLV